MKKLLLLVTPLLLSFASAFSQGPTISSINPTAGTFGTTITITGTNFGDVSAVAFGGTPASSFNIVSETTITAIVGSGSSGAVTVTSPDGTAVFEGFVFEVPPITLTKLSDGTEAASNVQFRLSYPEGYLPASSTTVSFEIAGTATSGTDFTGIPNTATIPAGTNSIVIPINVIDDEVIENEETLTITLVSAETESESVAVSPQTAVSAVIEDNDNTSVKNTIGLSAVNNGSEPSSNALFRVSFPSGISSSVATTVSYTVAGTATEGSDYAELSGSVTIPAGANAANIPISVINDSAFEGEETVQLTLQGATSSISDPTVNNQPAEVSIADDDQDPANNTVTLTKVSDGREGAGNVQFRVTVSSEGERELPTVINYSVSGSATTETDHEASETGTVTISPSVDFADITIAITDDRIIEPTETVTLTITSATYGGSSLNFSPATAVEASLEDNDNTPANNRITLSSVRNGAEPNSNGEFRVAFPAGVTSSVPTTVTYAVAGSATPGADYSALPGSATIPAGENAATITIAVTDDSVFEGDESVELTLEGATNTLSTLSVVDDPVQIDIDENEEDPANSRLTLSRVRDGAEGGVTAQFRVGFPAGITKSETTSFTYQVAGTALGGSDYPSLSGAGSIAAGTNSTVIDISIQNDQIIEQPETIILTLTSASAPITVNTEPATATINDNDNTAANNRITLTAGDNLAEPNTPGGFRVGFPTGITSSVATTVTYRVAGTASDDDHNGLTGSISIPANTNSVAIEVGVEDDQIIEGTETIALTLLNATSGISTLTVSSPTVSINLEDNDNSAPSNVITLAKTRDGAETGLGPQFTFSFPAGVTSSVPTTVNYSVGGTAVNGTDITELPGSLTIPGGANAAVLDVAVINDGIIETAETVMLTITSVNSSASAFTFSGSGVTATITDNDHTDRNNVITLTKLNDGAEPGTNARFAISYPEGVTSSATTTVNYTIGGTASNGVDFENLAGAATIPAGANSAEIVIAINDDQLIEITETVALTLTNATSAVSTLTVRPGTSVIANLADNDSSSPNTITLTKVQDGREPASALKFRVSYPSGISSSAVTIVNYSVGGTATSGQDFSALPGSVVIPAGTNSVDIDVPVLEDQSVELAETVELTLSSASNSLTTLATFPATPVAGFIADDDIPGITQVTPIRAIAGSTITIGGAKFDPDPDKNLVYFGPVKGTVTAASPTSLTVVVPSGAAYQPPSVTVQGLTAQWRIPFTTIFPNDAEVNSRAFAEKVDFGAAGGPVQVALGDFNSDQKTDLLALNETARSFSVLTNASAEGSLTGGSMSVRRDFPVNGVPRDAAIADLDGDGKLDIAVISTLLSGSSISLFRNLSNDSVSFEPPTELTTSEVHRIAIGDINGDGKPDLVVSGAGPGNLLAVYRNSSSADRLVFEPAASVTAGTRARGVVLADLNGDNKPDLAVANNGSNTVSVFRNISTNQIAFSTAVDLPAGTGPSELITGDWDQDGGLDLAVSNAGSASLSIFRNTGSNGNIAFATKLDISTGQNPGDLTAADLNGDGKADLISIAESSGSMSLFKNTTTGGVVVFSPAVPLLPGGNPRAIAVGDLNADSKPDLSLAVPASNQVSVLKNVIDQPGIAAANPLMACVGSTVTLTGSNFTGTTAVTFGNVPATSFRVISSSSITAVVPPGGGGNIVITTPRGTAMVSGFAAIPIPTIAVSGSTTFAVGGSVVLTASTGRGYSYVWQKDGVDLPGATGESLTALESGSYRVRILDGNCGSVSDPVAVQAIFTLPASNFTVSATSETCRTSDNGIISVSAASQMDYTATIVGGGINLTTQFTERTEFKDLASGTYNLCISVPGHPEFKQCFDVVVAEPEDLAVYTAVSPTGNSLELVLRGSETYYVELNGETITARQSQITLPLKAGVNRLKVSTGKECQGVIERVINFGPNALIYPNPFENILNVNLGSLESQKADVEIRNTSGVVVYSAKHQNDMGTIQMNVPDLMSGIYFLKLSLDGTESIYKIIRK